MKITSKYSIDDCVFIANQINQQNKVKANFWVQLYYYFVFANCFALSAFLFFLGYYLAGFILFLINLFFIIFLSDKIKNESYKTYYANFFSGDEYKETEIELLEDGISCKSIDGDSFFRWQNLREIVETPDKIYLFTKSNGITVAKNSFEFETQMQDFLIFAKARVPQNLLK
ncbi:MAG: YcxB family protein [Pyrinomonadaceae bacterium]|nr:YcxB family protein [Pyrinomonadaceae bacterium]